LCKYHKNIPKTFRTYFFTFDLNRSSEREALRIFYGRHTTKHAPQLFSIIEPKNYGHGLFFSVLSDISHSYIHIYVCQVPVMKMRSAMSFIISKVLPFGAFLSISLYFSCKRGARCAKFRILFGCSNRVLLSGPQTYESCCSSGDDTFPGYNVAGRDDAGSLGIWRGSPSRTPLKLDVPWNDLEGKKVIV